MSSEQLKFEKTKTALRVLEWLQDVGYQIEKSQFYQHAADGKVGKDRQGFFTPKLVKKYASAHLRREDTGQTEDKAGDELFREKQKAELLKIKLHNRKAEIEVAEVENRVVSRDDFERELAGRLIVLDSGVKTVHATSAPELVALVNGDPSKMDELIAALDGYWGDLLNQYASTEDWAVVVLPEPDVSVRSQTTEDRGQKIH